MKTEVPNKKVGKLDLWSEGDYVIKEKADRSPLLYLARKDTKNKQICQVMVAKFKTHDDALGLLVQVAKALIAGESDKPYKVRDILIEKYLQNQGMEKRPASASSSGASFKRPASASSSSAPSPSSTSTATPQTSASCPSSSGSKCARTSSSAQLPLGDMESVDDFDISSCLP